MAKRFCPNCCQNVNTVRRFKIWALVIGILFGIIPGILYWWFTRGEMCPMCHCPEEDMDPPRPVDRDF